VQLGEQAINLLGDGFARPWKRGLGAVSTCVFCSRFSVRDGAAAQLLPLLFSHDHGRKECPRSQNQKRKLLNTTFVVVGRFAFVVVGRIVVVGSLTVSEAL
jgi:hypothetical protein